mgnify:FL=1
MRAHPLLSVPGGTEPLIAVVDVLWFSTHNHVPAYGCFTILLRPTTSSRATLALLAILPGRESREFWKQAFAMLPDALQSRIVAIVADGFTGLMRLACEWGWHFQWCHVHIKLKIAELRGVRKLPGQTIRRHITHLIHRFLETADETEAVGCQEELRYWFRHPDCPRSIPARLSGVVRRGRFLRTYRMVPELNLPVSTNSAEHIHRQIRERLSRMRGMNSISALRLWISVIHRQIGSVACRGFRETIDLKSHRNFLS